MFKKFIFIFIFLITFMILPLNVQAQSYTTKDLSITIDEEGFDIFTRDNIKDNPRLEELGITYSYLNNFFNTNYVYLDACKFEEDSSDSVELFVVIKPVGNVNNLHTYGDTQIKELGEEVKKKVKADSYDVYDVGKYKYIHLNYYDSSKSYNIDEYYTVMNGYGYTILVQKGNKFTNDELKYIKKIVNSTTYKYNSKYEKSSSNISKYTIIGGIIGGAIGIIVTLVNTFKKKKKNEEN